MDDTNPQPAQAVLPGLDLTAAVPAVAPDVPPRFRMNERTRRIGRAGVAAARAQLAEQAARRAAQGAGVAPGSTRPHPGYRPRGLKRAA